jgi:SnoaL-like domain
VSDATLTEELRARIDNLESQAAIRAVMAEYMRLCDRLDASTPLDELGGLFTPDAVWIGAGARYGATFGSHHGRSAIVAMLDAYRTPPHFAFNAHFLTTETMTVTGNIAQGRWMMLQTSTYSSGASDLRSAKLTVEFTRTEAQWQISRFETENLFSRAIDRWDDPSPVPIPQPQHRGA